MIHELKEPELLRPRLKRVAIQILYAVVLLGGLYLFSARWRAFALLVPAVAVVVTAVFVARVWRILRFRHGERRHGDRRHDDRRLEGEEDEGPPAAGAAHTLASPTPPSRGHTR